MSGNAINTDRAKGVAASLQRLACAVLLATVALCLPPTTGSGLANQAHAQEAFKKLPNLKNHRTYLINGLASAIPAIGFGLSNLQKKLGGEYYSYLTPVEGSVAVQNIILRNIREEYAANRDIRINVIGVSYGANIATIVAARLKRDGIPVNYLGVVDSPAPVPITENVHRADNFVCRTLGCIGMRLRLARKNENTILTEFTYEVPHIQLSNDSRVQNRIVQQLTDHALFSAGDLLNAPVSE